MGSGGKWGQTTFGKHSENVVCPRYLIELFGQSIPSPQTFPNKVVTYAKDENGNVHRFEGTNGVFHWNGSTGDVGNPLLASYIPAAVQKALGVKLK